MIDSRRFVMEAVNAEIESIVFDKEFSVPDRARLITLLEIDPDDLDRGAHYYLDETDLEALRREFDLDFVPGSFLVRLRLWRRLDGLPYKVHTGRELALMLAGSKPLAAFSEAHPPVPDIGEEIPESAFDPYVLEGRVVKREDVDVVAGRRRVLYALPQEVWRIDAYLLLWATAEKAGWSEGFERLEGSLLGYQDWQNDFYIENFYRKAVRERRNGV